jgi:hypothetical protein
MITSIYSKNMSASTEGKFTIKNESWQQQLLQWANVSVNGLPIRSISEEWVAKSKTSKPPATRGFQAKLICNSQFIIKGI